MANLFIWFCVISFANASYLTLTARSGISFKKALNKDDFFAGEKNVKFTISTDGMPDMPSWMKFEQKDPISDAVIYGTPKESDVDTIKIEVIGWNKETYATIRKEMLITVLSLDFIGLAKVKYQLEFKIQNKDADEILKANNFLKIIVKIWPAKLYITFVEKATDRSGSYPLPGEKEGVFVRIGSNIDAPQDLKALKSICSSVPNDNKINKIFTDAGYVIDWCHLAVVNENKFSESLFPDGFAFQTVVFDTEAYDAQPENLTLDVVYVFIPILLGIIFIVLLTCVMCFNRRSSKQQQGMTSKEQHHQSLKRAAAQLRGMSGNDNDNRFAYGYLDEEKLRSGTPNRDNSSVVNTDTLSCPPPYPTDRTLDSKF